jgi:hypothetical protein
VSCTKTLSVPSPDGEYDVRCSLGLNHVGLHWSDQDGVARIWPDRLPIAKSRPKTSPHRSAAVRAKVPQGVPGA